MLQHGWVSKDDTRGEGQYSMWLGGNTSAIDSRMRETHRQTGRETGAETDRRRDRPVLDMLYSDPSLLSLLST